MKKFLFLSIFSFAAISMSHANDPRCEGQIVSKFLDSSYKKVKLGITRLQDDFSALDCSVSRLSGLRFYDLPEAKYEMWEKDGKNHVSTKIMLVKKDIRELQKAHEEFTTALQCVNWANK